MAITTITVDPYTTLATASVALLVGKFLNKNIRVLDKFHIPTPVSGGIFLSIIIAVLYYAFGYQFNFTKSLATGFMLLFFASIGLSADFKKLVQGGKGLILLLAVATGMVFIQNILGTNLAKLFGIDKLYGLIAGSITLVGGHGTGGAWGTVFSEAPYHLENASAIAFAAATYGLVMGGIVGGPVAQYLVTKHKLVPEKDDGDTEAFEDESKTRPIRVSAVTEGFMTLVFAMFIGQKLHDYASGLSFMPNIPSFVYVLFVGIIERAVLTRVFNRELKEVTIDVLGNVFLYLFLAISLISVKIWTLTDLALPVFGILVIQTVVVVLFSIFVTYNVMGRDYDAAVICAGQCGFSLGATPTAIANMQSVTSYFGPSHKAFLLIPLVGSFFIDLVNAFAISVFA